MRIKFHRITSKAELGKYKYFRTISKFEDHYKGEKKPDFDKIQNVEFERESIYHVRLLDGKFIGVTRLWTSWDHTRGDSTFRTPNFSGFYFLGFNKLPLDYQLKIIAYESGADSK
jgi:hypothetical protein